MKRVENSVEWNTDVGRMLLRLNGNGRLSTPICNIDLEEIPDFLQALTEAQEIMRKDAHAPT